MKLPKRYVIDIDGTICTQRKDYAKALPFMNRIKVINKLYDEGNEIIFFTARGSGTGKVWRSVTEEQLNRWKVKYHRLIFGKPWGDVYIDDRSEKEVWLDVHCRSRN